VLLERINRFFGWQAVGRIALRQAPLAQRPIRRSPPKADSDMIESVASTLGAVEDEGLRQALARLGAAVKQR
jgi:hypothetical protein